MTDDFALRKASERGERAERLLADDLYNECFAEVEASLMKRWGMTPFKNEDERENIWRMVKALEMVRNQLRTVAQTGKVARETLSQRAARVIGAPFRSSSTD